MGRKGQTLSTAQACPGAENVKGFPSPGGQSGGMFSTSPRLCQSVFLFFADQGFAAPSPHPFGARLRLRSAAASGLALDGMPPV